jgi:hypothetical protein
MGVRRIQNEFSPQEQRSDSPPARLHDFRQPHFGCVSAITPIDAGSIRHSQQTSTMHTVAVRILPHGRHAL